MGLVDWFRRLRRREGAKEPPDYPIPDGGIDALRADQQTALASGITPEEAARLAERDEE